jgi:hypothetical protein
MGPYQSAIIDGAMNIRGPSCAVRTVRDLTGITLDQPPVIPAFGICPWPRRPVSVRKPRAVSAHDHAARELLPRF